MLQNLVNLTLRSFLATVKEFVYIPWIEVVGIVNLIISLDDYSFITFFFLWIYRNSAKVFEKNAHEVNYSWYQRFDEARNAESPHTHGN